MELKGEKIIKTLEWCTTIGRCSGCPRSDYDTCDIEEDALALIKELTEENERLRAERDTFEINYKDLKYRNNELMKDAVAWEHECREWEFENTVLREALAEAKADTVREFAERVKKCFNNEIEHLAIYTEGQVLFAIDQITKEMLEG